MALLRNVLQEGNILGELYADTRSDVSDYSDNESMDSDGNVPTISTRIFTYSMSRNSFEYLWQAWHFSDNSQ
jgi:hypothetical protein